MYDEDLEDMYLAETEEAEHDDMLLQDEWDEMHEELGISPEIE